MQFADGRGFVTLDTNTTIFFSFAYVNIALAAFQVAMPKVRQSSCYQFGTGPWVTVA
jgi:hypothetical protein